MFEKLTKNWILITILLLGAILRLWQLGNIPPHLTPDEASLGYNAYSILKTGRDEYGQVLPIVFKSFGDYKPGLYIYLTVPFVATLGLNEFAVRLPSALCGILSIYLIFLIVRLLFNQKQLALVSAFIAAINPWLIQFSRGAWEVNLALTLTLLGVYFFKKASKKSRCLIYSMFLFSLSLLAYQGAKLSTGIVALVMVAIYWKDILGMERKYLFLSFGIGFLISLPIVVSLFSGKTGRLTVFSVFSYPRPKEYTQAFLDEGKEKIGSVSYYLFHSEGLNFTRGILGRWFNHFSGRFLFFEGDWQNPRQTPPNQGVLLLADFICLLVGVVILLRQKFSRETKFVWCWLLLSPFPAALSRDQVHAVRSFNMVVPLIVIISLGFYFLTTKLKGCKSILLAIYLISFIYFLDAYFIHLQKHDSQYWYYGYKQVVKKVTQVQGRYQEIKVQQSYDQPYIFFLFFQKYDPGKYQNQAKLTGGGADVGLIERLDNIEFGQIDWSVEKNKKNVLLVGDSVKIPAEEIKDKSKFEILDEIRYLDGREVAFIIVGIK